MAKYIDFSYVKDRADFETVLSHYGVELKGKGAERRGLCPFHEDKQPSFTANMEKKVYECKARSCGEKGRILDFVAMMEDCDLRTSAEKVAEICNIDLAPPRERSPHQDKSSSRKTKKAGKKKAPEAEPGDQPTNKPLQFQLKLDPDHSYGQSRSLSSSVIEMFEMGFCSRGMMKDRWCVPIHNASGECVAYIGRYIDDGDVSEENPKYMLPPNFVKTYELFNVHRVPIGTEHVVLVEGVFDAIHLHSFAVPVVGLLGSSISDDQKALLKERGVKHVTTMFDGLSVERAGAVDRDKDRQAREHVVADLARSFFVRDVCLPDGMDPDGVNEDFILEHHIEPLSG